MWRALGLQSNSRGAVRTVQARPARERARECARRIRSCHALVSALSAPCLASVPRPARVSSFWAFRAICAFSARGSVTLHSSPWHRAFAEDWHAVKAAESWEGRRRALQRRLGGLSAESRLSRAIGAIRPLCSCGVGFQPSIGVIRPLCNCRAPAVAVGARLLGPCSAGTPRECVRPRLGAPSLARALSWRRLATMAARWSSAPAAGRDMRAHPALGSAVAGPGAARTDVVMTPGQSPSARLRRGGPGVLRVVAAAPHNSGPSPATERAAFPHAQNQSKTTTSSAAAKSLAATLEDVSNEGLPRGGAQTDRPPAGNGALTVVNGELTLPGAKGASPALAYELVQGPLARWSLSSPGTAPPTAVFLHGILGSRKNWSSFARRVAREFPAWQMLLVDLRCHGESSTSLLHKHGAPHTVETAARDVLQLVRQLKLVPRVVVGHSFGGKVALSMVDQAKPLARPVQVWVLDATPGTVRSGGDGEDHPAELIQALAQMPGPITDRKEVVSHLRGLGFSEAVSQWMTTNLKAMDTNPALPKREGGSLEWAFDLEGIAQMYQSYEATNLWPLVEEVPEGARIEFLRAERSLHRWRHGDVQRINSAELRASAEGAGVRMHVLEDAGHWVHADNPDGLFRIMAPSFH